MDKILIVDNDYKIHNIICKYLAYENMSAYSAYNEFDATSILETNEIDLIILDLNMQDTDGFLLLNKIRNLINIPIIILSSRNDESDIIRSFNIGVDDYVLKPFSPNILMARIKAVLKRTNLPPKDKSNFFYLGCNLNYKNHILTIDNNKIDLTPKEYDLLEIFTKNPNVVITRDELIKNIWGNNYEGDVRTIDTHIKLLRKHLGKYKDILHTVRGSGYILKI